jgi:septum formation protein
MPELILASSSQARQALLSRAGVEYDAMPARIDEETARDGLIAEGASPRDIADTLAELKARKIAEKHPGAMVIGCDQILALNGETLSKPTDPADAMAQLKRLRGHQHSLFTATVIYDGAKPVWRYIAEPRLTMRSLSDTFITDYVTAFWSEIRHCVGCYRIEAEGIRLFSAVTGETTAIQGLPMPQVLGYLADRGLIAS